MPVQMMIEREGYNKFKLKDLNLNITGNSSSSSSGRIAPTTIHEPRKDIFISQKTTGGSNFFVIHDRVTQVTLPKKLPNNKEFQPANYTVARMVFYAMPMPQEYAGDLASGKEVKLYTKSHLMDAAINAALLAEKYNAGGRVSKYHGNEPELLLEEPLSICRIMRVVL